MRTLVLLLAAVIGSAEIVDRVAANIGHRVITDADVIEEARVEAFIEGTAVDLSKENKRKVLDRLVDQALMRKELEFTRFAPVSDAEIEPLVQQTLARHSDPAGYGITLEQLRKHVAWTLTMLRFIEFRFQPSVQITNAQVRQEYRRRAAEWRAQHKTEPPPLETLRADIEKILRQRLVDAALDRWLGEVRTQNEILYHGGYK